jgi:hypothetical protein
MTTLRLTNQQLTAFCAAYLRLEDVELDNERGMAAARLYAVVLQKVQAYTFRRKALEKERAKIIQDHAIIKKGEIQYSNPLEPDENKRFIAFKDAKRAGAAIAEWSAKAEGLADQIVDCECDLLPADFFEKPTALICKNSVRTGLLPFLIGEQPEPTNVTPKRKR